MVMGMGKHDKLSAARWDRASLAAGKALRNHPVTQCHVFAHDLEIDGVSETWRLRQMALAVQRSNYIYTTTKRAKDDDPEPLQEVTFREAPGGEEALRQASGMADGFVKARQIFCIFIFLALRLKLTVTNKD